MKTKYIKFIALIIGIAGLTSCNEWLAIQPEGKVVSEDYWINEAAVDKVVLTCYREMIDDDFIKRAIIWGELRSDNIVPDVAKDYDFKMIHEANILPNNPYSKWDVFYKVINFCNLVIEKAPKVIDPNFTQAKKQAKLSEVMTLRALCYFYLVRTFRDVPLVVSAASSDLQDYKIKQSTEDEVLNFLEKDLVQAEQWALMKFNDTKQTKGRITKNAVRALLADIYLWRNKYAECVSACDLILKDPSLKLVQPDDRPYRSIFGDGNSTESIFELQFDPNRSVSNYAVANYYGSYSSSSPFDNALFYVPVFMQSTNTDNPVFKVSPLSTVETKTSDVRRRDFITPKKTDNTANIAKYVYLDRFESPTSYGSFSKRSSTTSPNWIVYRLPDVMLMKAEALVQLNRSVDDRTEALRLVNKTYLRSNPTIVDSLLIENYSTAEELEKLVMEERHRELMFEGKRWFDLLRKARRQGKTSWLVDMVVRKYTESTSIVKAKMRDMNGMYWPINEDELKANPKLVQNPYYDSNLSK